MIVEAVKEGLELNSSDILLDLCCGNGALTNLLLEHCRGGLGVDFSEHLIEVAKSNFECKPDKVYLLDDAIDFLGNASEPTRFTKILCYGSFAYLEAHRARELLQLCLERFPAVEYLYIGNLPDKDQLGTFYSERTYTPGIENEPDSAIGIWRTRKEFCALTEEIGWRIEFRTMPEGFYASQYRFDAILTRNKSVLA
jgi:SAM-dependent methyltransferase